MNPWLDTVAVLVLIGNVVTSAPAPHSAFLYKRVARPHGVAARQLSLQSDPEGMFPNGVFLPPDDDMQALLDLQHIGNEPQVDDPLLLTGTDAINVVNLLLNHGELFFGEIPHARALLRHEQERIDHGLSTHLLGSNRPDSPFYRWSRRDKIQRQHRIIPFL